MERSVAPATTRARARIDEQIGCQLVHFGDREACDESARRGCTTSMNHAAPASTTVLGVSRCIAGCGLIGVGCGVHAGRG
jgi:hypothetical protein